MGDGQTHTVIRYIRRLAAPDAHDQTPTGQLLDRFVHHQDEAAFAALVQRFAPIVWGVCRRVLSAEQDAEDAFQATFLVFVRKAKTISKRDLLGNWLYGVAYRIALRARASAAKRHFHERQAQRMPAEYTKVDRTFSELALVLDDEVRRLPAKYRVPFVLCYLENKTNEAAAREIGCPKGTVLSRLARAREKLRYRLTSRGITLSSGALALALSNQAVDASVPFGIIDTTVNSGILFAGGKAAVGAVASPHVAALTQGALRNMFMTKLLTSCVIFLFGGSLGTGAGVVGYQKLGAPLTAAGDQPPKDVPNVSAAPAAEMVVKIASRKDGIVLFIGAEAKEGEKITPERISKIREDGQLKTIRRLDKGDPVEEGQLLARLDDPLARMEFGIKESKMRAAEAEFKSAEKSQDEAYERFRTQERLLAGGHKGTSIEDFRAAKLLWDKSTFETQSKKELFAVAKLEWNKAKIMLEMNEIRSPVRGEIKKIHKHPGDAVKNLETVITIRIIDK
jgi:RNA polymerase sigma factor (sigma-70 family)